MQVSSIGSVGVLQFQALSVSKPGPTAARLSPDSAMWGNSVTPGSTAVPSPDSAMWGNSVTPGSLNVMA
jgi:hypothetical protein